MLQLVVVVVAVAAVAVAVVVVVVVVVVVDLLVHFMKPMGRNLHGRTHLLLLTATIQAWSEVPSSGVNERGVALGSTFWKPARTSPSVGHPAPWPQ